MSAPRSIKGAGDWNPVPEDIRGIDPCGSSVERLPDVGHHLFTGILDEFARDTGSPIGLVSGGIESMIDDASGYTAAEAKRFIEWFNANIWSEMA